MQHVGPKKIKTVSLKRAVFTLFGSNSLGSLNKKYRNKASTYHQHNNNDLPQDLSRTVCRFSYRHLLVIKAPHAI